MSGPISPPGFFAPIVILWIILCEKWMLTLLLYSSTVSILYSAVTQTWIFEGDIWYLIVHIAQIFTYLVFIMYLTCNSMAIKLVWISIEYLSHTFTYLYIIVLTFQYKVIYIKQGKSEVFDSWDQPCNLKRHSNWFFSLCDLEIWRITSENNREPLPCSKKLCVSFYSHPWIEIEVVIQKCSNQSKIIDFSAPCDFEIWQITLKKIRHHFYATWSFVHHFIAICEFKLELQSRNVQFWWIFPA